jgi:hypothetical protein
MAQTGRAHQPILLPHASNRKNIKGITTNAPQFQMHFGPLTNPRPEFHDVAVKKNHEVCKNSVYYTRDNEAPNKVGLNGKRMQTEAERISA